MKLHKAKRVRDSYSGIFKVATDTDPESYDKMQPVEKKINYQIEKALIQYLDVLPDITKEEKHNIAYISFDKE